MQNDEKNTAIHVAFEECPPHDTALPERNLLRAILLTAMSDLKRPGDIQREAVDFFMSEDERYVFSFVSICNHLDLDPKKILMVTGLLPGHINPPAPDTILLPFDAKTPSTESKN